MKAYLKSPKSTSRYEIECDGSFTAKKSTDRFEPREASFTVSRKVPAAQFSEVIVAEQDQVMFRGYVETYTIDSKREKTLNCVGMEGLLNKRFAPPWYYPKGTTFGELFSDTLSEDATPGLIAVANGALAPGVYWTYQDEARNIVKIETAGTASRIGACTIYKAGLTGAHALTSVASLAALDTTDNAYYRDSNDLYVRIDNEYERSWPDYGGLIFDGGFDTSVRLGEIASPNMSIAGDLTCAGDAPIGDMLVEIAAAQGYYIHIYDDWNYTYLWFDGLEGRDLGTVIYERDLEEIEKSIPEDPRVHALTGMGAFRQFYTACDLSQYGTWVQDVMSVDNGYVDDNGNLVPYVDEQFAADDWQWKIKLRQREGRELLLVPGDFVTLKPYHEPDVYASISQIEYGTDGSIDIELGKPTPEFAKIWDLLQSPSTGYKVDYMQDLCYTATTTANVYVSDTTHPWSPSTDEADGELLMYDVPAGVLADGLLPRAILTISLTLSAMAHWVENTGYFTNDWCSNGGLRYKCKTNHTAASSTEPGVGASWETYWEEYEASVLELGRAAIKVQLEQGDLRFGNFMGVNLNDSPQIAVDVTDDISEDTIHKFYVLIQLADQYGANHSSSEEHPRFTVSGTLAFFRRKAIE